MSTPAPMSSEVEKDLKWIVQHTANTCSGPCECVMGFMSDMNKRKSMKDILFKHNIMFMNVFMTCHTERQFIECLAGIFEFPEAFRTACDASSTFKELAAAYAV